MDGRSVDFGKIPVGNGELLPAGKLDGEKPDTQRLMEATGNEGASFERSYHRAAIVIWDERRTSEVLLASGAPAFLPYLKERIKETSRGGRSAEDATARQEVVALTKLVIAKWEAEVRSEEDSYWDDDDEDDGKRATMLRLLAKLGEESFIGRFIKNVVTPEYDGSENGPLANCVSLLEPQSAGDILASLIEKNMPQSKRACLGLLAGMKPTPRLMGAIRTAAKALVNGLAAPPRPAGAPAKWDWMYSKSEKVDASFVAELLQALRPLNDPSLSEAAAAQLCAHPAAYPPDTVVAPGLSVLAKGAAAWSAQASFIMLWRHCAAFLLARSEFPPAGTRQLVAARETRLSLRRMP